MTGSPDTKINFGNSVSFGIVLIKGNTVYTFTSQRKIKITTVALY